MGTEICFGIPFTAAIHKGIILYIMVNAILTVNPAREILFPVVLKSTFISLIVLFLSDDASTIRKDLLHHIFFKVYTG